MFVRVKKIKNNHYAYLVENEWTAWGSRQKVNKYLGRAIKLDRVKEKELEELPKNYKLAVLQLVIWELLNHGFKAEEQAFVKGDIIVDLAKQKITVKGKPAALEINEGFLCGHTLQQLLDFTAEETHKQTAQKLAKAVLEAGLKLPEEAFVQLFELAPKTF